MNEQAEIMTDILTKLAYKGGDIDIFNRIGLCTLDIICGNIDSNRRKSVKTRKMYSIFSFRNSNGSKYKCSKKYKVRVCNSCG